MTQKKDLEIANFLCTLINLQIEQFSKALIKLVLCKEENKMKIHSGSISLLEKNSIIENQIFDYGCIMLITQKLDPRELCNLIMEIAQDKTFTLNGIGKLYTEGYFGKVDFVPSKARHGQISLDYPRRYTTYSLSEKPNLPHEPLALPKLPLYPDGNKAAIDFLNLRTDTSSNEIVIQIPDYRFRIIKMTISGKKVKMTIESKIPKENLVAKFYADHGELSNYWGERKFYSMKSPDLVITGDSIEFDFDKEFSYLLGLIQDRTSHVFDYRGYNLSWGYQEGVEIDRGSLDIMEIIRRGEDLVTEFKQDIGEQFLETVVSFSNTKGGVIFLGVTNNGQIGNFKPKTDDQITNLISSNVDPKPSFHEKIYEIDGKTITIVEIPEGKNKPYNHIQNGFYIRSGSTDRHPTRAEMDTFYEEKRSRPYNY